MSTVKPHISRKVVCEHCVNDNCFLHRAGNKNVLVKGKTTKSSNDCTEVVSSIFTDKTRGKELYLNNGETVAAPSRGLHKPVSFLSLPEKPSYDPYFICMIDRSFRQIRVNNEQKKQLTVRVHFFNTREETLDPKVVLFENGDITKKLTAIADVAKGAVILKETPMLILKIHKNANTDELIKKYVLYILKGENKRIIAPIMLALDSLFPRDKKTAEDLFVHATERENANLDNQSEYINNANMLMAKLYICLFVAEKHMLLYRMFSFINHSCRPNCVIVMCERTGLQKLVATEDIKAGTDVTIEYDIQRRRYFKCQCFTCLKKAQIAAWSK